MGHILSFARSLGETNSRYFAEPVETATEVKPIVAPPTFTEASHRFAPYNPFRFESDNRSGSSDPAREADHEIGEDNSVHLHAEQHFEYHRTVVAGETLKVVGRKGGTWQKEGRRGGLLTFSESFTDFFDVDGQIVITARTVGVTTSMKTRRNGCDDPPQSN